MDTPNEQVKFELYNKSIKRDEAWMAIALSHPTMSNRELIEIGMYLRLDYSDLLDLAIMLGDSPKNLELLKILSEQEPYSNTLFENYSLRIQRSALAGHI
ncbi:ankyrin repeat protein [Legionella gratiana]|uniref:Ankyrin repeat protein n=2 Tax=Legionella gratiana TaxID=45066 RepID=A0A378J7Y4_9GAMM|nr:ankyrin repeat protein [Legionella gratiana]STX43017.1 ankyrin repeat protein [Legionella gratiana]